MATRKRTTKRTTKSKSRRRASKKQTPWIDELFATLARPEVIGLALVIVSAFTLLSLITPSRGQVMGPWVEGLTWLVGIGVWGLPVVTGMIGLWIVVLHIERTPDIPLAAAGGPAAHAAGVAAGCIAGADAGGARAGARHDGGRRRTGQRDGAGAGADRGRPRRVALCDCAGRGRPGAADGPAAGRRHRRAVAGIRRLATHDARAQRMDPSLRPDVPVPDGVLPWHKQLAERVRLWWAGRNEREAGYRREVYTQPGLGYDDFANPPSNLVPPEPPPYETTRGGRRRPDALRETEALYDATGGSSQVGSAENNVTQSGVAQSVNQRMGNALTESLGGGEMLTPRIVGSQEWALPSTGKMLEDWDRRVDSDSRIRDQGRLIQETLENFGIPSSFEGAYKGPAVTQYLIKPGYTERVVRGETRRTKVKVAKIAGLANDLALALAASNVRIEAPIPGTSYVGVEVPNQESNIVGLKELMESEKFQSLDAERLRIALGEDVKGQSIVSDLTKMPHLLIAGATGSGKSAGINSILSCLLLTHTPDSLRLLMVDPKMVELSVYNGIPHLLSPVVTEVDKAAGVLYWAVKEMERRYTIFSKAGARDLPRYNKYLESKNEKPLPYIVVIIDEMADLMMAAPEEVEKYVCRLAQMARAVGIHLIIATQRPSVNVITGLIKANFPARIAFAVTSQIDSRVILDIPGAERLLGKGDMLFMSPDASKLERLQGSWVGDSEIQRIVQYWKGIRQYSGFGDAGFGADDPFGSSSPAESALYDLPRGSAPGDVAVDLALQPSAQGKTQPFTPKPAPKSAKSNPRTQPLTTSTTVPVMPDPFQGSTQAPLLEQVEQMQKEEARDNLFDEAVRVVQQKGRGSVSLLQRELRIGYNRASRLVDDLEEAGVLGPDQGGSRGRDVLVGGPSGGSQPRQSADEEMPAPRIIGEETDDVDEGAPRVWF